MSAIPKEAIQETPEDYGLDGSSVFIEATLPQEATFDIRASIEAFAVLHPDKNRPSRQRDPLETVVSGIVY